MMMISNLEQKHDNKLSNVDNIDNMCDQLVNLATEFNRDIHYYLTLRKAKFSDTQLNEIGPFVDEIIIIR